MKKTVPLLLILSLLVGMLVFPVSAETHAATEIPPDATEVEIDGETYQVIRTTEAFFSIGNQTDGNYILANDLDFEGWTGSVLVQLSGTICLDGNGYSIYNYQLENNSDVSTFGVKTGSDIEIRSLTLGQPDQPIPVVCEQTSTGKSVGAVFGYANCTFVLDGLTAYVDVQSNNCYSGGLLGNIQGNGTVLNCTVWGSLDNGSGTGTRGGIIGQISNNLAFIASSCVSHVNMPAGGYNMGGIAGRCISGKRVLIENCANYGALNCTKYAGGIIGQIQPKNVTVDLTVRNCTNYGTVTGGTQSGGIFGDIGFDTAVTGGEMLVENCVNYGAANGENEMSGIAGRVNARYPVTFRNCANYGAITGTTNTAGLTSSAALGEGQFLVVEGFLNAGEIRAGTRAGGVLGWLSNTLLCELKDCINIGALNGSMVGGISTMAVDGLTIDNCACFTTRLECSSNSVGYMVGVEAAGAQGTGNRYIGISGNSWNTVLCETEMNQSEALQYLNENYADVYGGFVKNTGNDGFVPAAPKLAAVQESAVSDGKQDVRLIGTLQDSLQYAEVGFLLQINGIDLDEQTCSTVYEKVLGRVGGSMTEVSAAQLGGKFLYALTIRNIPAEGETVIHVTPFGRGLEADTVFYGASYTVQYQDGIFISVTKAEETEPMNIKVGTFNIQHGNDYQQYLEDGSKIIDLSLATEVIREQQLDICGLNEVYNNPKDGNQAKQIADSLGYEYVFARAIDYKDGEYGNALVSRYPVLSAEIYPIVVPEEDRIDGQDYENRALLCAELLVQGRRIHVLVTHFGLHDDEFAEAVRVVEEVVAQCSTPVVLMGDFNLKPDSSYYDELSDMLNDTVGAAQDNILTFPSQEPNRKIDYVFVSDRCRALSAYVPAVVVSDHRPYVTELEVL